MRALLSLLLVTACGDNLVPNWDAAPHVARADNTPSTNAEPCLSYTYPNDVTICAQECVRHKDCAGQRACFWTDKAAGLSQCLPLCYEQEDCPDGLDCTFMPFPPYRVCTGFVYE